MIPLLARYIQPSSEVVLLEALTLDGLWVSAIPPKPHLLCVLQDFRGRDPSTEPLLRHNDLLPAAA